jgi:hypothetical protein
VTHDPTAVELDPMTLLDDLHTVPVQLGFSSIVDGEHPDAGAGAVRAIRKQ